MNIRKKLVGLTVLAQWLERNKSSSCKELLRGLFGELCWLEIKISLNQCADKLSVGRNKNPCFGSARAIGTNGDWEVTRDPLSFYNLLVLGPVTLDYRADPNVGEWTTGTWALAQEEVPTLVVSSVWTIVSKFTTMSANIKEDNRFGYIQFWFQLCTSRLIGAFHWLGGGEFLV